MAAATQSATLGWFARHELRLFWRDFISMLTAGKRHREGMLLLGVLAFATFIHLLASWLIAPFTSDGVVLDKTALLFVMGSVFLYATMMTSQAMESVTRAFYARSDMDMILSSPASSRKLFAVRMLAVAVSTTLLTTLLAGPFINAMAWHDGPRWLAGYGVIVATGMLSTAAALVLTVLMFRCFGPKRTRLISQIFSAVVGAAFVIGIQAAAILTTGNYSRFEFLGSEGVVAAAPGLSSPFWWPAFAAAGEPVPLTGMLLAGAMALAVVIFATSASFGSYVVAAAGADFGKETSRRSDAPFRRMSVKRTLRRKEWMLIRRDPWLISQSLMQILYLLPPALLLWINFGDSADSLLILVPVIVMASGQLAGGLAWLAVSGEDAHDLIDSAPVPARVVIDAKMEAVLLAVAAVAAPLLLAMALVAPAFALAGLGGIALSARSATMVQIWFRDQAKRGNFRRRQTSSRVATVAEALSSILWAATAGIAAAESWLALGPAFFALLTLLGAWMLRPRREG